MSNIKYTGKKSNRLKAMAAATILASGIISGIGVQDVSASVKPRNVIEQQYSAKELKKHKYYIAQRMNHLSKYEELKMQSQKETIEQFENMTDEEVLKIAREVLGEKVSDFSVEELRKKTLDYLKVIQHEIPKTISEWKKEVEDNAREPHRVRDRLLHMKILPPEEGDKKKRVELSMVNLSDFSVEQLKEVEKNYVIDHITINKYYTDNITGSKETTKAAENYSVEEFVDVKNAIEKQFGDLKSNSKLTQEEKVAIVVKRLGKLQYDHTSFRNWQFDQKSAGYAQSARSALLSDKTICLGVSEAFTEVCTYLDIEASMVIGINNAFNEVQAHVWNQVKIKDNWYNVDLTQAMMFRKYDRIFKSDESFKKWKYIQTMGEHHEAPQNLDEEHIKKLWDKVEQYEKNKESGFLRKSAKKLSALGNKLFGKERQDTMNLNEETSVQENTTDAQRKTFISYLSGNGKYANLEANVSEKQLECSKNMNKDQQNIEENERV